MTAVDTDAAYKNQAEETSLAINALEDMSATLTLLDNALPALVDRFSGDVEALGGLLLEMRERRQKAAELEAFLESRVARIMPKNKLQAGEFALERRGGARYTDWDNERVAAACIDTVIGNPETGELTGDPETAYAVRDVLLQAAAVTWRTTKLREIGVEFDGMCKREQSRRTVQVRRVEPGGGA